MEARISKIFFRVLSIGLIQYSCNNAQYGYNSRKDYPQPLPYVYDYPTTTPAPVNACPEVAQFPYLYGEDLYRAIVEVHANTSYNIAAITKQYRSEYASSYSPWQLIREFADGGAIVIGIAYGLVDNSNPQTCLANARFVARQQATIVSHRNDFIPVPPGGGILTGEAALECVVKQKGETTYVVNTVGSANVNATYPGPYLKHLIDIAKSIVRLGRVVATNDTSSECQAAISAMGATAIDFLHVDHTDRDIQSAYVFPTTPTTTTPYYTTPYYTRPPIIYYKLLARLRLALSLPLSGYKDAWNSDLN